MLHSKKIEIILRIFARFPILILYILMFAWVSIYIVLNDQIGTYDIMKVAYSLINMCFLSLGLYMLSEIEKLSKLWNLLLQMLVILFWVLFYFYILDSLQAHSIVIFLWIFAFIFSSWFLLKVFKKEYSKQEYGNYFEILVEIVLYTIIAWILSALLWVIAINSFVHLFQISFQETWFLFKLNSVRAIISLSVIAPMFGLSKIPNKFILIDGKENTALLFIVKYIFIWFFYLFFTILYGYSIKVLLDLNKRPSWQLPFLIALFSSFAYMTYFISEKYESKENSIKFFRKILPFAVIPQIFLLFYAIWVRIMQYDLTINRYIILIFWIRILLLSIYFIVSKQKRIINIPLSLSFVCLTMSIGPWSFENLPQHRQLSNLKSSMIKAWVLKNWEIVIPEKWEKIDKKLWQKIYWEISYLCRNKISCKSLKKLFSNQYKEFKQQKENRSFRRFLLAKLDIEHTRFYWSKHQKSLIVDINYYNRIDKVKIKEYDYIYHFTSSTWEWLTNYEVSQNRIKFKDWKQIDLNFNLVEKIKENKDKESIKFEFKESNKRYKIIIESAYIREGKNWKKWININWILLVWDL